jgi:SAM-dependent methyltransferase
MATSWDMPTGSGARWADDYERGRPGWPPAALDVPGLPASATVLELGAGTGRLTGLLVDRFEEVVAVEPADAMRRHLVRNCPEAEVLDGHAQAIPAADFSVDAVFAAEAFHRFDHEPALSEIERVLRPGGALILMWNVPAGPWEPSPCAAEELLTERGPSAEGVTYDPLDLDGPNYWTGAWREALAESPFDQHREANVPNPQTLGRSGLVAFFASMGWLAELPDAERLPVIAEVRSLLTAGEYRRTWETRVHAFRAG